MRTLFSVFLALWLLAPAGCKTSPPVEVRTIKVGPERPAPKPGERAEPGNDLPGQGLPRRVERAIAKRDLRVEEPSWRSLPRPSPQRGVEIELPDGTPFVLPAYRIETGDVIQVTLQEKPAFPPRTVQGSGTIDLPEIGTVQVRGRTLAEVKEAVFREYDNIYRGAQVTVALAASAPRHVIVVGSVARPGSYPLAGPASILSLLGQAGFDAASEEVDRLSVLSGGRVFSFKVGTEAQSLEALQGVTLQGGETIFVHPTRPVLVKGEVTAPGPFKMGRRRGVPLVEVLSAFPLKPTADRSRVLVRTGSGPGRFLAVDLAGNGGPNHELFPGDVVLVPHAAAVTLVGAVTQPGQILLSSREKLTIGALLARRGGLVAGALRRRAVLIRKGGSRVGVDLRRRRALDFVVEGGDSLFVPRREQFVYYVIGKVLRPGVKNAALPVNVLQALTEAGHDPVFSDLAGARLVRDWPHAPRVLRIDFKRVLAGRLAQNVTLDHGDVLYVPPTTISDVIEHMKGLLQGLNPPLDTASRVLDLQKKQEELRNLKKGIFSTSQTTVNVAGSGG